MLLPAFGHGMIKDNISLWMTLFVVDKYGIELSSSALYVLLIPTVGLIGRLLYPPLYRLLGGKEDLVSTISFGGCILAALPLIFGTASPLVAVICLSLIYAMVSLINTSILSIFPVRFAQSGNVSSVSGLMDLSTYMGAGVGSLVYGLLIDGFGYTAMVLSFGVISLVSLIWLRWRCRA